MATNCFKTAKLVKLSFLLDLIPDFIFYTVPKYVGKLVSKTVSW